MKTNHLFQKHRAVIKIIGFKKIQEGSTWMSSTVRIMTVFMLIMWITVRVIHWYIIYIFIPVFNFLTFQLLGQAPVSAPGPPLPLQTINLPSGINLAPGTVLTLQNGQVCSIGPIINLNLIIPGSTDRAL